MLLSTSEFVDVAMLGVMRHFTRHGSTYKHLVLAFAGVLVAGFLAIQFHIFTEHHSADESAETHEAHEALLYGALLSIGLLVFAALRLREQQRETNKRVEAEHHVRKLAFQDPLTGLPNRRQFNDALTACLAAPPRAGAAHAVLMMDLNGFKQINDVYGHGAGEEVLIVFAQRVAAAAREGDVVARLGGDEFVILAQHLAGAETATGIARRIIEALASPIVIGNVHHQVNTGIGICLFPFEANSLDEVMRRADVALYEAKSDRVSSVHFFDQDMDRHVKEREYLERELRAAIASKEIRPFFQPLVDLKTREIVGFEALARWTHGELGELPPSRFIPVAEDTGLINDLTDQLLRAACLAAMSWPASVMLSFNISPVQLKDRTLGLRVLSILAQTGLSPHRLEIEITESALVRDLPAAQEVLGSLREAGIRLALDDFGTGYSSLYHLRNFKLDTIKIDRSFVESMGVERESAEIVSALIGLGKGLGLTIVAEGIQEGSQEAKLLAQGCQQGQGYRFSEAVPAEEAERLVSKTHPLVQRA